MILLNREKAVKEIKSKCDTCLHSRVIISENSCHSICWLSSKQAVKCMMNNYNKYITLPEKEEDNND